MGPKNIAPIQSIYLRYRKSKSAFFVSRSKKTSIDAGHQSSEPPTPPPPLVIEDLLDRKQGSHIHSLDDIFNFEKNILYGRETTL